MTLKEELDRFFYGPPNTTLRSTSPPSAAKLAEAILGIAARIDALEQRHPPRNIGEPDDHFHFPHPTGGERGSFDFSKKG